MPKKILTLVLVFLLVLTGCTVQEVKPNEEPPANSFGISSRKFRTGISGFAPRDFPRFGFSDLVEYWSDVRKSAEVYGIHTEWSSLNLVEDANKELDMDFEVVLGFQEPVEWKTETDALIKAVTGMLRKYPQIKYLGIGNEINIEYENNPADFTDFLTAYKKIYTELKALFPSVQIFTVFQYEALKGEGYLTGFRDLRDNEFFIVNELNDHLDLIAVTLYPMLDYKSPAEIPASYFDDILSYGKKIAVTETGWMARETYAGLLKTISDDGYTGSEAEQADYLNWLIKTGNTGNFEFINWFHINDPFAWENGDEGSGNFALFDSISLKKNDGTEKKVWPLWQELKTVKYQN